ncbi:MAG TPA: 1,4-alpha-glucan branching protein GlgB [Salinimicrobium sp.]|nr:1,4-alpha-glucan branching protein GlgB [Salinimicrobium sp.]
MKLPNTSTSDDLREAGKAAAKNISEKLSPERETQEFLKNKAEEILPERKKIKDSLKEAGKNIIPDPNVVDRLVDKIIPGEEAPTQGNDKEKADKKNSDLTAQPTLLSDYDIHLFREGKHFHLYQKLGSHPMTYNGVEGVFFALWAPNAKEVSVTGDFNQWNREKNPMKPRGDSSGIWEVFIPEAKQGNIYKYFIISAEGYEVEKGDPYAFMWEIPPNTASVVWDLSNSWSDGGWLEKRRNESGMEKPVSVLEVHLGSWRRKPEENSRSLTYSELAQELPAYIKEMGFTHVEFMPVMEHPFFGSWGYQITGYFAPSSRFGTPQEFMHLIEVLHQQEIGVILDWVPSHFPGDLHGLHFFDGTFLYEHADPRKGFHPDWQSYIFNYGRNEVRSFLISNAIFWLDKFHADGLRVDAVASMLYLDYSRKEGEWEPNKHGGNENIEAIEFLKEFNEVVYSEFPDIVTIAEESTAWPMVSKPTTMGGLGFGMKWMMGWMHDTLEYFKKDPLYRSHHQNTITFSTNYAFSENFMLPLSHDEVVYGKGSLLEKMPGDQWNKFANLRSLYSYMYGHPGTKLLFMGAEFGQRSEWNHDSSLDWHLMEDPMHQKLQKSLQVLNQLYKNEPALYQKGFSTEGFRWIDFDDSKNSVISFLRRGIDEKDDIIIVGNFTPVPRENYRIGVPKKTSFKEIFNSDDQDFGGSNVKNDGTLETSEVPMHGFENSMVLTLPPMGVIYLKSSD